MAGYTIEFDVGPALTQLDKVEKKLTTVSTSASNAGSKAGAAWANKFKAGVLTSGLGKDLSDALNGEALASVRTKGVANLVQRYQQQKDANRAELVSLQKLIVLEKERNDLLLARDRIESKLRTKLATAPGNIQADSAYTRATTELKQQYDLVNQIAKLEARERIAKSKDGAEAIKQVEALKVRAAMAEQMAVARAKEAAMSTRAYKADADALAITKARAVATEKRVAAQASLAAAMDKEVQKQLKLTNLAAEQLAMEKQRAAVKYAQSKTGKDLATEVELNKLLLQLEKERAVVRSLESKRGTNAVKNLEFAKLEANVLREQARLTEVSSKRYRELSQTLADVTAQRKAAARGITQQTKAMKTNAEAFDLSSKSIRGANAALKSYIATSKKTSQAATVAAAATAKHKKHIDLAAQSTSAWRAGLAGLGSHMGIYTSSTILAASAVYGLSRAIKGSLALGVDFEKSMQRAFAVMGVGAADSEILSGAVRRLGKETVFTAKEVAEGLVFLGMAGQSMDDAMSSLYPTLQLSSIGMIDMGKAADIVTNILGGFQMPAENLKNVVDDMSTAVVSSNMNIEQLGSSMSYVAPVAHAAGVELQTVVAALEVLHNSGIKGTRAGTGLRRTIFSLYNTTTKGAEALAKLGVETVTAGGRAIEFVSILEQLNKKGATLSDLGDIVGVRAAPAFIQLVKAADGGTKSIQEMRKALDDNAGAADRLQKSIEDFLGADVNKFVAALQEIGLMAFKEVEADLRSLTQSATEFLKSLTEDDIRSFIGALDALATSVLGLVTIFTTYKLTAAVTGLGTSMLKSSKYTAPLALGFDKTAESAKKSGVQFTGFGTKLDKTSKAAGSSVKNFKASALAVRGLGIAGRFAAGLLSGVVGVLAGGAVLWAFGEGVAWIAKQFAEMSAEAAKARDSITDFKTAALIDKQDLLVAGTKLKISGLSTQLAREKSTQSFERSKNQGPIRVESTAELEAGRNIDRLRKEIADQEKILSIQQNTSTTLDIQKLENELKALSVQEEFRKSAIAVLQDNVNVLKGGDSPDKQALTDAGSTVSGFNERLKDEQAELEKIQSRMSESQDQLTNLYNSRAEFFNNRAEANKPKVSDSLSEFLKAQDDKVAAIGKETSAEKALAEAKKERAALHAKLAKSAELSKEDSDFVPDNLTKDKARLQELTDDIVKLSAQANKAAPRRLKDANKATAEFDKFMRTQEIQRLRESDLVENYGVIYERTEEAKTKYLAELRRLQEARAGGADVSTAEQAKLNLLNAEYNEYNALLKESIDLSTQRSGAAALSSVYDPGSGELPASEREALLDVYMAEERQLRSLSQEVADLNKLSKDPNVVISAKKYNSELRKRVRIMEELKAQSVDATRQEQVLAGAKHGLEDYHDEVSNVYDEVRSLTYDSIKGLEDVLVEFNKTGKLSFTDLIDHIETELLRLANQRFILEPLTQMFDSMFPSTSGGSMVGGSSGGGFSLGGFNLGSLFGGSSASSQVAALAPYGGGPPVAAAGSGGGFLDSLWSGVTSLFGFANGGEFNVGGSGGTDSQVVAFKASPNETVTVRRPDQKQQEKPEPNYTVNNYITVEAPNGNVSRESLHQIQVAAGRSINNQLRRNG